MKNTNPKLNTPMIVNENRAQRVLEPTCVQQRMMELTTVLEFKSPEEVPADAQHVLDCGTRILVLMFAHATVCAWCSKDIKIEMLPVPQRWVSHGICPDCAAALRAEQDERDDYDSAQDTKR